MKNLSILLIVLISLFLTAAAQTKGNSKDISAIKSIALKWQSDWNRHDMKALAALVAEDVDFITVGGVWQKNRKDFEKYHAQRHEMQFKKSVWTTNNTTINSSNPMLRWRTSNSLSKATKTRTERRANRGKGYLSGFWKSAKEIG